jgi:hypothetical protein
MKNTSCFSFGKAIQRGILLFSATLLPSQIKEKRSARPRELHAKNEKQETIRIYSVNFFNSVFVNCLIRIGTAPRGLVRTTKIEKM